MLLENERQAVVEYSRNLLTSGLVKGTGGNISCCNTEKTLIAITPSGVRYETMRAEDVVVLAVDGTFVEGALTPSSETAFHIDLMTQRPDIHAVVHTHSTYATTIACLGWELPAVHYLVGHAGYKVPIAPYATFGTRDLSDNICSTLGEGNAVLMANHGLVAVGTDLKHAFATAEMIEYVSQLYLQAKAVGEPIILDDNEMAVVLDKFKTYGQQPNKK